MFGSSAGRIILGHLDGSLVVYENEDRSLSLSDSATAKLLLSQMASFAAEERAIYSASDDD